MAKTKDRVTLLLDSGAFTAWKSGCSVDLKAYIAFIKRYEKRLFAYVNLDVIPGAPKQARNDPEGAAAASYRNLQIMQDAGLKPMPVFHQFEHLKWLVKMVEDGHKYIGISPSDRQPTRQRMQWLDQVYTVLCDSKGRPYVKTHALGATSVPILCMYPFYSADSSTWIVMGGHGRLRVPGINLDGSLDYTKHLMLTVSEKTPMTVSPIQWTALGPLQAAAMEKYITNNRFGFSRKDIETDYIARSTMEVELFQGVAAYLADNPVRFKRFQSWLPGAAPPALERTLKALPPFAMQMFFVAWANKAHDILCKAGANNRLLSFLHVQDWTPEMFDSFMQTGLIGGSYTPRQMQHDRSKRPTGNDKGRTARSRARRADAAAG